MYVKRLLLLVFLQSCSSFKVLNRTTLQRYCDIDPNNTPCLVCGSGSRSKCIGRPEGFEVLQNYAIRWILHKHNEFRNQVFDIPGLEPASNMNMLSWDQEAEFFAICHVLRLQAEHDTTRITLKGEKMGQNMFHMMVDQAGGMIGDWTLKAMNQWMYEADALNVSEYVSFCNSYSYRKEAESFSQMLWANTKYVGCAYYFKIVGKQHHHYFFCNYLPPGNIEGERMYIPGEMTCASSNVKYENLCGNRRNLHKDPYKFPVQFPMKGPSSSAPAPKYSLLLKILLLELTVRNL